MNARVVAVVGAGSFHDPQNARVIYLAVAGLLALAVTLAVITVVWWRRARVEHPVLGPLEVMSSRRWRASDHPTRESLVDRVRAGAADEPPHEPIDLTIQASDEPHDFRDLVDDTSGLHRGDDWD